jgi:hypothetical protein
MRRCIIIVLLALLPGPALAHALDEYVQAALVSVERDRIALSLRLVPGVAIVEQVLPLLDTNCDGTISEGESRAYARGLITELRLTLDGKPLALRLANVQMPPLPGLREGLGAIHINLEAAGASAPGTHQLVLENLHQPRFSAYLANGLRPRDAAIRITAQSRNETQSRFEMTYTVAR